MIYSLIPPIERENVLANDIWRKAIVSDDVTVEDLITCLNSSGLKIVLIVDAQGKLVGTVTDGDLRRAFLRGVSRNTACSNVINKSAITVNVGVDLTVVRKIMHNQKIHQIPVISKSGMLVGLHTIDDFNEKSQLSNQVLIMAGGRGTRMKDLTLHQPKPMLKVLSKPILQHTIEHLVESGFKIINVSVHYLGNVIEEYFGDGSAFGCKIKYLREDQPLDTAGALSLMDGSITEPIIVVNADIIAKPNFRDILEYHQNEQAHATMAVSIYEWKNPYGVILTNGTLIDQYQEKPNTQTLVNAGIYVFSPLIINQVKQLSPIDMKNLFDWMKDNAFKCIAYPLHEKWIDVGRPEDYINLNFK